MENQWIRLFLMVTSLLAVGIAQAGEKEVRAALNKQLPNVEIKSIRPAAVKGMFEIVIGAQVYYVSDDGRHLFLGKLIEMEKKRNLTELRQQELLADIMGKMPDSNTISFAPAKTRRTMTVFTDVDCPYCAKLHQEVPKLNAEGVKVRYLMYPRRGLGSSTYKKSVAVWCAGDQADAIGRAKKGETIPMKDCKNPVSEHYQLGQEIGISGTPAIVLDDGRILGGYAPASQLLPALGLGGGKK